MAPADGVLTRASRESLGAVLAPAAGNQWKAPLRAEWVDKRVLPGTARGVLSCALGNQETAATFDDWSELERAYHFTLESRRAEGTLRDAMLTKNGNVLHSWNPDSSQTTGKTPPRP